MERQPLLHHVTCVVRLNAALQAQAGELVGRACWQDVGLRVECPQGLQFPSLVAMAVHEMPGNLPLRYVLNEFTKPALRSVAAQGVTVGVFIKKHGLLFFPGKLTNHRTNEGANLLSSSQKVQRALKIQTNVVKNLLMGAPTDPLRLVC